MPKKILLAEDSLTIQKVFELTFAQSDFVLTMVDNGTDAVRLAAEISPDLVVADVTLPGRNGFEVAGDLAASGVTRNCPVLILSGSLGPFDEERFKGSGARGVLFKPFESQELIDKVNEMLSAAEAASDEVKGETAAPGTEEWDFSDVLEEVEDGHGRAAGLATGATTSVETLSLGEYDVSVDELEGPGVVAAPAANPEPPAAVPPIPVSDFPELDDAFPEAPFSVEAPCEDEPAGITDISPALAEVEELEEIEDLEEMELLHKESEGPLAVEPLPAPMPVPAAAIEPPTVPGEPGLEGEAEVDLDAILGVGGDAAATLPDLEPAYASKPEPEPEAAAEVAKDEDLEALIGEVPAIQAASAPASAPQPSTGDAADLEVAAAEALREQFSVRARAIVEKVATEAVEKVMWEWMERLTAEFAERIRETVESVAWDVIPKTAEALIREEILRIREKEGKQGESR